jgi:hypothetical protein
MALEYHNIECSNPPEYRDIVACNLFAVFVSLDFKVKAIAFHDYYCASASAERGPLPTGAGAPARQRCSTVLLINSDCSNPIISTSTATVGPASGGLLAHYWQALLTFVLQS